MTVFLVVLALLAVLAFALLLSPLRQRAEGRADDGAREALDEDYRASLAAIRELDEALARGEVDPHGAEREKLRLSGRAARTLAKLEALPPAPPTKAAPPVRPALVGLVLAAALVVVGAFTFLPRWQLAGLGAGEAFALQSALKIPSLAQQAERTRARADYLAWGRAAFDASRFEEAARAYAAVLQQDPRDPEALRRVGIVLIQGGEKAQDGINLVAASARLDPKNDEGQLFLGFALARLGQDQEALGALERYRTLNPQGRDADDLISALRARQGSGDVGDAAYRQLGCASCHGAEGRGGVGPSLRNSQLSREGSAAVIRGGAAGMKAYGKDELPDAQLNAILDLLQRWQAAERK